MLKILNINFFCYVDKILSFFINVWLKKDLVIRNPRRCIKHIKSTLDFLNTVFFSQTWEKIIILFQEFSETLTFLKSALFHCEMVCLTNFGLDRVVYIVNAMIFIKKHVTNFLRITFNRELKVEITKFVFPQSFIVNPQSLILKTPIPHSKSPIGNCITNWWFPLTVL